MSTVTAKTAKPKATATRAAKAAPAKKAARAAKPKAAPVAPEAAAVAAFTDAYRAYNRRVIGFDTGHVSPKAYRAARATLCKLAGCDHEVRHRVADCAIGSAITNVVSAIHHDLMYRFDDPDHTGPAGAALTHRLSELTASR